MFSKRSLSMLSSSERQLLRSQWLRSGQCARCFHASISRGEGESSGNGNGTPPNATKPPSKRAQRSARISSEVAMLQKGPPPSTSAASDGELKGPGSATGSFHAPPAAPGSDAGFLETPNEMGGPAQRMGENVSAGREGPNAQGVGRPVRTEGSAMGGAEANPGHHREWMEKSARPEEEEEMEEEDVEEEDIDDNVWSKRGAPITPQTPKIDEFLHSGQGASTIAGRNFEGVIRDRLKAVSIPHSPDAQPRRKRWDSMEEGLKREVVNKLVKGQYDGGKAFEGKAFLKQPVLNDVARMLLLNGTYRRPDGDKLLEKVRKLLPVEKKPAAAAAGKGNQKPQAVKK